MVTFNNKGIFAASFKTISAVASAMQSDTITAQGFYRERVNQTEE
jgi:hypothetical protein